MMRQSSSAGPCKYLHNYYIKKRLCKNFAKEKREKKKKKKTWVKTKTKKKLSWEQFSLGKIFRTLLNCM